MKKHLLFILCWMFYATTTFAQMPMGAPKQANIGHIYGKIVDSLGKPMEFASVLVMSIKLDSATKKYKDVLLKGQVTEGKGEFDFTELPLFGRLKLKITSIGYKDIEMPIVFQMNTSGMTRPKEGQMPDASSISKMMSGIDKDLGNIKMSADDKVLEGVTITATKALFEMNIDKKVFNVDKNIVSTGGTAVDIMRNVPSVQVDIDGNVKVRNAAPQIFVDGRPTTLTLDQIPADAIEKVEVMTNPSAKYDASGTNAGILNLVLKKNKKSGYNGMISTSADRFGGGNVMGNFNVRQNKVNFSAIVMTNQMRNNTTGDSERQSEINSVKATTLQDISSKTKGNFTFGRVGMDYFATNRTTISLSGIMVRGIFKPNENIGITTKGSGYSNFSNRLSETDRQFRANGFQGGVKHNFPKAGEEWTMDVNYFGGKSLISGLYTTNYYTSSNTIFGTQLQQNAGNGTNAFMVWQTDYVKPLTEKGNLEMGLKAQINEITNLNDNTIKPLGATEFKKIVAATTNYENQNSVYAAYASLSGAAKKNAFSYKIGLRAESSRYTGKLLNTNQDFGNKYPISLFPSLFLTKELKKGENVQVNITRRVNRPNFFQQIPFLDFTDSLNISRGNAELLPEFTYSSEASYSKTKGTNTFLGTIYYKYTNNLITRFLSQELNPVSGKTDFINTFVNANSSQTYGLELTYTTQIKKWWDLTSNLNFYRSEINTTNLENQPNTAIWTPFGKLNNNFKLPKKWTIQLSGDFQGKTNLPITQNQGFGGPPMMQAQSASQGYIKPYGGVDVAVKKTFLKNDVGNVTLNVNDIFKTRGNAQFSEGAGFSQTYFRLTNPQMVRLNVAFRFGKMDMSLFKKQNMKGQTENMQNGMQMGG
jgi:ferric enterobactin receptor